MNDPAKWQQEREENRKDSAYGAGLWLQFLFFFFVVLPSTYVILVHAAKSADPQLWPLIMALSAWGGWVAKGFPLVRR
ncbi:MAG: hypothetical protein OXF67_00370 [Cyanobacteria bacterium MAG CAR4_bin_6]|nr:hypothetical protein [Cyanobacteria bacterium MAG CAR4_bin_6]